MGEVASIASHSLIQDPPNAQDLAVYCRSVVKRFGTGGGQVTALGGIDLDVRAGELMMLVGPSGCGKTTLISVVAGILNQDAGICRVFGREFSTMNGREKTRHRGQTVGFVFQSFNLIPALSAIENAAVPLLILGRPRKEALAQAGELLDRVGLGSRMKALPGQLSGGQQQRVAIARALVHAPPLIVCDEPTSALDHETGHKVMELLREIAVVPGRSLLIVTHDARIFGFADRIAKMDDGKVMEVQDAPGVKP
jgi:putative ABC transport system ATP-binding protein